MLVTMGRRHVRFWVLHGLEGSPGLTGSKAGTHSVFMALYMFAHTHTHTHTLTHTHTHTHKHRRASARARTRQGRQTAVDAVGYYQQ